MYPWRPRPFLHAALAVALLVAMPGLDGVRADGAPAGFQPPSEDTIPDDEFGKMVRFGKQVFTDTAHSAPEYSGNGLNCSNCHLDAGRRADSSPLWAAWVSYPAYRAKNHTVNTMERRIQECFLYSMNGKAPPSDSDVLKGLMSYAFWLATGAPTNTAMPGRGYPKLAEPTRAPDFARGAQVFGQRCAQCHGADGKGLRAGERYAYPPLWGDDSFNWGAGMHQIDNAAAFIRANMPLGQGGSLSLQDAWDVALFVDSHPRPPDPRDAAGVAATDAEFHKHRCRYGDEVDGAVLGVRR